MSVGVQSGEQQLLLGGVVFELGPKGKVGLNKRERNLLAPQVGRMMNGKGWRWDRD